MLDKERYVLVSDSQLGNNQYSIDKVTLVSTQYHGIITSIDIKVPVMV